MPDNLPLSVAEAIAARRAVRAFQEREIPGEILERVIAQTLEAPSAFNAQARDLVVVRDENVKRALYEASGQKQFLTAPATLIAVGRAEVLPEDAHEILPPERIAIVEAFNSAKNPAQLREAALRDAMLLAGFAMLAAAGEGLATSPTSGWDEEAVKQAIGLGGRADRLIALVLAVGYADEKPRRPGRLASRRINDSY
ncbi:nitroreductase family protein [Dermabacteraceae bacterium P7074]